MTEVRGKLGQVIDARLFNEKTERMVARAQNAPADPIERMARPH